MSGPEHTRGFVWVFFFLLLFWTIYELAQVVSFLKAGLAVKGQDESWKSRLTVPFPSVLGTEKNM